MQRVLIICVILACALPALAEPEPEPAPAQVPCSTPSDSTSAIGQVPAVQHVPVHEAFTGAATLRFYVHEPDRALPIIVHCVPRAGERVERATTAQRALEQYVARVPDACAQPPGFDYWVTRGAAGSEQPVFASAAAPHPVRVTPTPARERELVQLRTHGYRRSRAVISAEGVDFGDRHAPAGSALHDRYFRVEMGYAYAFFGTIDELAFTLVRVRGEHGVSEPLAAGALPFDPGIDYGQARVTLALTDSIRIRNALLLGASQRGFEYGVNSELVLGDPAAEHLAIGGEHITTLGTTGRLRLGFNATRAVPMAASVEVTDFPLGKNVALRLLYEIGYRFTETTELRLRGGYQGRTSVGGGPSLGVAFSYGF